MIRPNLAASIEDKVAPQFNPHGREWIGLGAVAALTVVVTAGINMDAETMDHLSSAVSFGPHAADHLRSALSSVAAKSAAVRVVASSVYHAVLLPQVGNYAMRAYPDSRKMRVAVNQGGNIGCSLAEGVAQYAVGADPLLSAGPWMGFGLIVPPLLTELKMRGFTMRALRAYGVDMVTDIYNGTKKNAGALLDRGRDIVKYIRSSE